MNDSKNSLLFFAGLLCKIVAKLIFFLSSFDILQRDSINMRQLIADFIEGRHLSWSLLKRNCTRSMIIIYDTCHLNLFTALQLFSENNLKCYKV